MYYFFGAGNNCHSAIFFWGREKIIAIVDNDISKIGTELLGIKIIDFKTFKNIYNNEMIIITTNTGSESVKKQLEKNNMNNYYICPYMQSGFYSSEEIVSKWNLQKYDYIYFYRKTPLAEAIISKLKEEKKCKYYFDEKIIKKLYEKKVAFIITEKEDSEKINNKDILEANLFDLNKDILKWHTEEFIYLKKFYNIHDGKECFLIGNGPSLNCTDLDKIYYNKIISFGCNGIYKIFSKTNWKPDYYMLADNIFFENEKENLPTGCIYFIRKMFSQKKILHKNAYFYYGKYENFYPGYPSFSNKIEEGVYGGRTIMYDMLQFAIYMGFKKIYLLGVDFTWGEDGHNSHFIESYSDGKREKFASSYKKEIQNAYFAANQFAKRHGIEIFNVTRGGNLEIFQRKEIDKIFMEIEDENM